MRSRLLCLTVLLSACSSDPASEQPIKVRPGMYEAKMSAGIGPFSLGSPEMASKSCVTDDETEFFPQTFTRQYLSMDGACDGPLSERKGNLVTGTLTCESGGDDRQIVMNYAATVHEERVDVDIKGEISATPSDLEDATSTKATLSKAIKLGVTIRRVGDC